MPHGIATVIVLHLTGVALFALRSLVVSTCHAYTIRLLRLSSAERCAKQSNLNRHMLCSTVLENENWFAVW
jgi:hypothetical protein